MRRHVLIRMTLLATLGCLVAGLLSTGAAPSSKPPPWRRTEIARYGPAGVYRLGFRVPASASGMWLVPKSYLDDFNPSVAPRIPVHPQVTLAAAPGEAVPATCLILASAALGKATVYITDLTGPQGAAIAASRFTVRRVVRTPVRQVYSAPPTDTRVVGRFLPRWRPRSIAADGFAEIWLTAHVPANAKPGDYHGRLIVAAKGRQARCPIGLTVYPFHLRLNPAKSLGIYISMDRSLNHPRLVKAWLKDLRTHGVNNLVTDLTIEYVFRGKVLRPDFTAVRQGLDLIRASGMTGTIVIQDGLAERYLYRYLGLHQVKAHPKVLKRNRRFWMLAKQAMLEVLHLQASFPTLHLAVTHLDEVFNNGLLPWYIELAKAVRQVPQVPLYVTIDTENNRADRWRHEVEPYANILANHGYTFEWWLARGHSIAEYKHELAKAGDVAWLYYNDRGAYFTAKWARIINGFYLWVSPFRVNAPYIYQSFQGNPYNDTDGNGSDFGMAFPGLNGHPLDLVPTRVWEAMRQGGDDLRYVATLQYLMAKEKNAKPQAVAAAQKVLDALRNRITAPLEKIRKTWNGGFNARCGTPAESPLIHALAESYTGAQWQALRRHIAEAIITLQNASK